MIKKPIAISLSPNTEKQDISLAAKMLFSPGQWLKGEKIKELESSFKDYFKVKYAVSFNSGRSAEYALLKAMDLKKNDEVLIQAFTCVVVPNPILWLKAKPIYVDFEKDTLNMSPRDLKKKITSKSKIVVVQHTFGKPAKMDEIKKIAKDKKLLLIEDCAHSLGAKYKNKKLGTDGEAAFFSFGRDKIISSVFGGMAITNNDRIGKKLLEIQKSLSFPSRFWVGQQLFHPLAFEIILPLYNLFSLGKLLLVVFQKLNLLSRAVSGEEKMSRQPRNYPRKLANAQATLALSQFHRLAKFNQKRKEIGEIYRQELKGIKTLKPVSGEIFMRYTILSKQAKAMINEAKKKGILLGDWYQNIVDPQGVNFEKAGYSWGSCPVAEEIASQVVNLPTYPRMGEKEARRVINLVKAFLKKNV
ncbi:MAG TPA: DegT/DnrJ/EryC1/StrS aminotransferase family protein [Patescibacteria group bacterium]|nr:DegT/DnrJ/EryC1/StrS aminotransferase family protein [Patescibacteria group bacterium]